MPTLFSFVRLAVVATVLLSSTACLEHFETLTTTIAYDPFSQQFHIERRLSGVNRRLLGCTTVDDCIRVIERSLSLTPDPTRAMALSDRLLQRLIDSGATDLRVTLERNGEDLEIIVSYNATVGSPAADDTLVRAEWRSGLFSGYYLVVTAQDNMSPPSQTHRVRKVARSVPGGGADWVEEWVLRRGRTAVQTELPVGEKGHLFFEMPALADALQAKGWLGQSTALADTSVASGSGAAESGAPDPESPAKVWIYEARISGGGVTPAAAAVALEPLVPGISVCYQVRQRDIPELEGNLFLSALVRPDGEVVATAVNGSVSDPELLACVDRVLMTWQFSAWTGEGVSDVAIPVVFRVEGRAAPKR